MNPSPSELLKAHEPRPGKVLKTDRQMSTVRFSPCGKILVAGCTDSTVRRWDLSTDSMPELPALRGHDGFVQSVAFCPRGRLFTADSWGRLSGWDLADASSPRWSIAHAHDGWIRGLAVSPDGESVATCGSDRKVSLRTSDRGELQHELRGHADDVFAIGFHPSRPRLVSGDLKGNVKVWDLDRAMAVRDVDARVLHRLDRLQDTGGVRVLAFNPEGNLLACAGTQPRNGGNVQGVPTILVFDAETWKLQSTLKIGNDGDGFVYDLRWHPAGFLAGVTSGNPGTGKLFFIRPGDDRPFYLTTRMANCHSLDANADWTRLVVSATNPGSNGNGRKLGKEREYPGNWSPLHFWTMPGQEE